jgi:hypothetical protein
MGLKKDIKIDHDKCVTTLIKAKTTFFLIENPLIKKPISLMQGYIFVCFASKLLNEWLRFILEIQWLILVCFTFKPK